jgi:hypothetical protein
MSTEPSPYRWVGPYDALPLLEICEDCGSVVADHKAHVRFHDTLNEHAGMLGKLKVWAMRVAS